MSLYRIISDVLPCNEEMLKDLELEREELEKEKAGSRQRQDPHQRIKDLQIPEPF